MASKPPLSNVDKKDRRTMAEWPRWRALSAAGARLAMVASIEFFGEGVDGGRYGRCRRVDRDVGKGSGVVNLQPIACL
jgi:hypothetical protein